MAQEVDDFLLTRSEATHGAAEGLAECARVDVHAVVGVEELADAVSRLADNAGGVAFVHHHEGVVLLSKVADLVHRSHISVHGEYAVRADDAEALSLSFL